jgi:hypothetical protein
MAFLLIWSLTRIALRGLSKDPRFDARPDRIHAEGPAWGGPGLLDPVLDRLEDLGTINLFDPRFEERIRDALLDLPCVASVNAIQKRWPSRYGVDVILRRPVAVVLEGERRIPVTGGGVVLPAGPYAHASRGLLEIRGVPQAPPRPGHVWQSAELASGLETVAQLSPHLDELAPLELACVDVTGAGTARTGVYLYGGEGITVRWGRPLRTVGENPVERKLLFLKITAGQVDRVRGLETDVRFSKLYCRQPTRP